MFGDLMGKLGDMKSKMAAVKERLSTISVQGESSNKNVVVTMDGNKVMKDVEINFDLNTVDKEELQDMMVQATNRAIEQAEKVYEAEMAASAKDFLPGMGL
ncbi:MAG: YbaB/EbfC family nucleoid-associated protein [Flavobacteriales bacterium]|nr:YbaB/EbfC family nucleoid-associated protein [Flavobacteriales bacterium]